MAEMLRLTEHFEGSVGDYAAVCFAAPFPDAAYPARSDTDEEESAAPPNVIKS